jgi:hypothetical protein
MSANLLQYSQQWLPNILFTEALGRLNAALCLPKVAVVNPAGANIKGKNGEKISVPKIGAIAEYDKVPGTPYTGHYSEPDGTLADLGTIKIASAPFMLERNLFQLI